MKKLLYLAAIVFGLMSCSKVNDELNINTQDKLLFTADIVSSANSSEDKTKTQIDAAGKLSWVFNETESDEITIKDNAGTSALYHITALDENGRATFAPVEGQPQLGEGPYTATYGDINNQVYNAKHLGSNCPMEAKSTGMVDGLTNLSFHNTAAVIRIKVKSDGAILKKVSAAGKDLILNPNINISEETTFDVAIPAGEYNEGVQIDFVCMNGIVQTKKTKTLSLKANQMHPVTVKSALDFNMKPLDGQFTINADGDYVRFAPGNVVQAADGNYAYEGEQYYFHTLPSTGSTCYYAYDAAGKQKHSDNIGLFIWPTKSEDREKLKGTFPGWDLLNAESTDGEWYYLTMTRTTNCTNKTQLNNLTDKDNPTACYTFIVIKDTDKSTGNEVKIAGCLLFPDTYAWPFDELPNLTDVNYTKTARTDWNDKSAYSSEDFKKLEEQGFVFLPAIGRGNGSQVQNNNFQNDASGKFRNTEAYGLYMTSLDASDNKKYFQFTVNKVVTNKTDGGSYGRGIRFVVRYKK